ncbi:helix-turn-helix transcriptional regulator [Nocardia beijingensis]
MTTENFLQAADLEGLTGIPAATWRYWAHKGVGPASFKLGRRRVYRQSVIDAWIAEQEARTQTGGGGLWIYGCFRPDSLIGWSAGRCRDDDT